MRNLTAHDRERCERKRHYAKRDKAIARADAKSMRFHYGQPYQVYWCTVCGGGWVIGSFDRLDAIQHAGDWTR